MGCLLGDDPGPGDGLFWFTGAVENLLPAALGGAVVALLARSARTSGLARVALRAAALVGALAVPGLHELHGLSLCLVLVAATVLVATTRTSGAGGAWAVWPWAACAVLSVLGAAVVVVAPGNAERARFYPPPHLLVAARITAAEVARDLPAWALSVPLLAATALFVAHPSVRAARPAWVARALGGSRGWLVPALTLALVVGGLFVPSYALSSPPAGRTLSGVYLMFLLGWFASAFVLTRGWVGRADGADRPDAHSSARRLARVAALVLAASLVAQGNTRLGLADLVRHVGPWRAAMRARYATLRASQSPAERVAGVVVLPRVPRAPDVFFAEDIEERPAAWRNACVAGYFGVPGVALAPKVRTPGGGVVAGTAAGAIDGRETALR